MCQHLNGGGGAAEIECEFGEMSHDRFCLLFRNNKGSLCISQGARGLGQPLSLTLACRQRPPLLSFPHCTSARDHSLSLQYSTVFSYTDILPTLTAIMEGQEAVSF